MLEARADLSKLRAFLRDLSELEMTDLHRNLGDTGVQIVEERFDTSKDPQGRPWRRLKRDYVLYSKGGKGGASTKTIRSKNAPPLKFRHLYKSFSFDANQDRAMVGTPLEHAKYHTNAPMNNGRPRRVIPLREFMGYTSTKDGNRLLDTVVDFLEVKTAR